MAQQYSFNVTSETRRLALKLVKENNAVYTNDNMNIKLVENKQTIACFVGNIVGVKIISDKHWHLIVNDLFSDIIL